MKLKIRGSLLVLLMFLLVGASTQAASCEVRCDLGRAVPACHQAMAMTSQMETAHGSVNQDEHTMRPRRADSSLQKICRMPQFLALCETVQTYSGLLILPLLQGTVITKDALDGDGGAVVKVPFLSPSFHGPLAGQLRV